MSKPRPPVQAPVQAPAKTPANHAPVTADSDLVHILRATVAARTEILRRTSYEDYLVVKAALDALPPFPGD